MQFNPELNDALEHLFRWCREVRHFRDKVACLKSLGQIIEQCASTPATGSSQPWRLVEARSQARRQTVRSTCETMRSDAFSR